MSNKARVCKMCFMQGIKNYNGRSNKKYVRKIYFTVNITTII